MENPGQVFESAPNIPVHQQLVGNRLSVFKPTGSIVLNSAQRMQMIPNQIYTTHLLTPMPRLVHSSILPNQQPVVVSDGKNWMIQNYMPLANQLINRNANLCGDCGGQRTSLTVSTPNRRQNEICQTTEMETQTDTSLTQNSEANTSLLSESETQNEVPITSERITNGKVTSEVQTDKSFSKRMPSVTSPEVSTPLFYYEDYLKSYIDETSQTCNKKPLETPTNPITGNTESQQQTHNMVYPASSTINSSADTAQTKFPKIPTPPFSVVHVDTIVNNSSNMHSAHEIAGRSEIDKDDMKSLPPLLEPMEETECTTQPSAISSSDLHLVVREQSLQSTMIDNEDTPLSPPSLEPIIEDEANSLSPPSLESSIESISPLIIDIPENSVESQSILEQSANQQLAGSTEEQLQPAKIDKETDSNILELVIVKQSLQPKVENQIQRAFVKPHRFIIPANAEKKNVVYPLKKNLSLPTSAPALKKELFSDKGESDQDKEELMKCEFCERLKPKYRFKRLKRFCSISCSVKYKMCNLKGANPSEENSEKVLRCQACDRLGLSKYFKKSKRFCSKSCAIRFTHCCSKHVGMTHKEFKKGFPSGITDFKQVNSKTRSAIKDAKEVPKIVSNTNVSDITDPKSSHNEIDSTSSKPDLSSKCSSSDNDEVEIIAVVNKKKPKIIQFVYNDPSQWSVSEVSEFLGRVECSEYIEKFQFNEIDGEALLMLELHHLMSMMDMKLGTAVKLLSNIKMIKNNFEENKNMGSEKVNIMLEVPVPSEKESL